MAVFATEFPVSTSVDRGRFAAQVIAWVKGMPASSLFDRQSGLEQLEGEATIRSDSGEQLTLRECKLPDGFAIGARHEIPDDDGRLWRSEVILKSTLGIAALRTRTQCTFKKAGARVQLPRKPYFVKLVLDDGWQETDGLLTISSTAKRLAISDLELASSILRGEFETSLPVIYVSCAGVGERGLSNDAIEKLSFRLGGVAHVIVEPSREFSRRLQIQSGGRNPYGGAIGVAIGGLGLTRRFLLGRALADEEDILQAASDFCTTYMADKVPKLSWDWQDLLEESSKQFRRKATSTSEELDIWNKLRDEENIEKDQQIALLRDQIENLQNISLAERAKDSAYLLSSFVVDQIGIEVYESEFSDRILLVLKDILAGRVNIDARTRAIISKITSTTRFSGGAGRLEDRIKTAGRDSSQADSRLAEILLQIGFNKRVQGGHPVFLPGDLTGLGQHTLSSSPSDHRAGRNAAAQIVRDLGLSRMKD